MISVKEIKDLKQYLIETFHAKRIKQQEDDQKYIEDNFAVSYLPAGTPQLKTGKAYRMVSSPAEHIVTRNPLLYRYPKGKATEAAKRVGAEGNRWLRILSQQSPQPFKEHIKKLLGKGEAWIYVIHNETFNSDDSNDLPVQFIIPDPLIVYADGWAGEKDGIPKRVIICYERVAENLKRTYPTWAWKNQNGRQTTAKVPYFMYFDDETRFAEADDEALLTDAKGKLSNGNGLQENIYGIVPLVHAYAGFGESDAEGDPSTLCIGRITNIRDLIAEYTAIRSTINHLIMKYAQPPMDYKYDPTIFTPPPDMAENYDRSPAAFNRIPITPGGGLDKGVDMLPDVQLFQHLYNIEKQIDEEDPLGLIGQAIGTSGRQQITVEQGGLRRYDSVVDNCASAFEVAFGLGLRMCEKLPHIRPKGIQSNDIDSYYQVKIQLRAEDPIESERNAVAGSRYFAQGEIDLRTNLTKYKGYTQEEADDIITNMLVDKITLFNPDVAAVMGVVFAKEAGMETYLEEAAQRKTNLAAQQKGLEQPPSPSEMTRTTGETATPLGTEMVDEGLTRKGMRRSPRAYFRGGV